MSGPHILAVDLGTSGPKAAVVSLEGHIVATARSHVTTLHLPDGGAEQDPEAVWGAVKAACTQALRESGVASRDVLAIACSSQYSSIVPVDAKGRAAANMMLWLDKRGAMPRLRQLGGFPRGADGPLQLLRWLRRHGLPPVVGGISLTHMRYFKYARPDVYERTAAFLEPMDYVTMRLTGRATANQCTAFMMLATDNRRLGVTEYDDRLVRASLIDREKLPELVPLDAIVGTVLPEVADEIGLGRSTRVVTGLNDTQSGGIGTYAFAGTHAAISIGSTGVMITHVPWKRTDIRHSILSMPSPVPGRYFVMAENGVAGGALEHVLTRILFPGDASGGGPAAHRYAALQRALDTTRPGAGGVLFLPWMGGSLAPRADSSMRGGFLNLGLDVTREQLARAVLEGVALNLRWLKGPTERFAKREFTHFLFYSGGAESDGWAQILADALGAPVHQLENPQYTTCLGMALLAFQRLGLLGFDDFQRLVRMRRVYNPDPQASRVYADMAPQFVAAFERNRPIFRALNRVEKSQ